MNLELAIALATITALAALIIIAVVGRLNSLDDDDPPTITIHPPLPPDDGKW